MNEAFAQVKINQLLKDAAWKLSDGRSVRFEYPLDDDGKAVYALFDRNGRALDHFDVIKIDLTASSFVLTQEVRSESSWTHQLLSARQKRFVDVVPQLRNLDVASGGKTTETAAS